MAVEYTLRMPEPHTHLFEVTMRLRSTTSPSDLVMPSWTPGSYLIREFARHVQDFTVTDANGTPLGYRKIEKNRWRVEAGAGVDVVVFYRVYANELSVRTSHLDASHGYVNGASIFMDVEGGSREQGTGNRGSGGAAGREGIRLVVEVPEEWRVATSLPRWEADGSGGPGNVGRQEEAIGLNETGEFLPSSGYGDGGHEGEERSARDASSARARTHCETFRAADYDELVDCPIEIGTHELIEWEQEGRPHRFAVWGAERIDAERLVRHTRRIIDVCARMFGGIPYDEYLFILLVAPEGRGGLEHMTSSSLLVPPTWLEGEEYESLLALIAHEFFHVWLGKRIRPAPLGPFDYTRENYTRNLWVVEGFTTYYTDLILRRAGLISEERYLERLGDSIARYQALPGRKRQSLEDSSFDTWIRFYRPDADTPNSQVSYYHKGSLVALVLDLELRRPSEGMRSLDDVMRQLWEQYRATGGGFAEEGAGGIRDVVERVYGASLASMFERFVSGVDEMEFDAVLAAAGLELLGAARTGAGGASASLGRDSGEGGIARSREGTEKTARDNGGGGEAAGVEAMPREVSGPRLKPPAAHEERLGVRLREEGGRVRVTHVLAGTAAYAAGVNAGDEIVAVSGVRATVAELNRRAGEGEGAILTLTLLRRDRLLTLAAVLGAAAERRGRIGRTETAGETEERIRSGWLGTDAEVGR